MPKINQLKPATSLANTDIMIADTSTGSDTRKIAYSDLRTQVQNESKSVFALKGEVASDEQVADAVGDWLDTHVTPTGSAVAIDDTLKIQGAAADAKAAGEIIVINGTSGNGTRVNITTTDTDIELAEMSDVDDLKNALNDFTTTETNMTGSEVTLTNVPYDSTAKNVVLSNQNSDFYVGGNMFPTIAEQTKTNNGVTSVSDGKGKLSISGTATAQSTNIFILPDNVEIKAGMCVYFRNTQTVSGAMSFYTPDGTGISGGAIPFNALSKVYEIPSGSILDGKTIGRIGISMNNGTTVNMTVEPMLLWTNDQENFIAYYPETKYTNVNQFLVKKGYNHIRVDSGTISFDVLKLAEYAGIDYVDNEISETKEYIDSKVKDFFAQEFDFESRKYDETNSGIKRNSAARIRNSDLIPLDYVKSVVLPSGYDAQMHFFNKEKQWTGYNPAWVTSFEDWNADESTKYIALTIRSTAHPNSDISGEVQTVKNNTIFEAILENHLIVSEIYPDVIENLKQARRTKNTGKDNYLTRNKPLTLFHFSDIHGEQGNLRNIVSFSTENGDLIDDTICTGDMVGIRFQNGMEWFDGVPGAENILLAIGNHDVMNAETGYDDTQTATLQEVYEQFIEPYYMNWNLTSDPSSGVTYYCKDYADSKVRLIVIDCMLDSVDAIADSVQRTWFANTLADAITNGLYVVVANHCFPSGASFVVSNWTNADYQSTQTYLDSSYPEAVDTFIGNGGHFVCWLEGHSHADYYMNYTGTHGTQMALSVDAASRFNAEGFTDVNRLEQDRSYNSANLVTIDTGAEVIKVVKFGAKTNYKLIPRSTLTIDFGGNIIVQN